MLLNVVAVPATVATCVKFVQRDPWQRSIRTSVWLIAVFVQFRRIELLESDVAVKAVGAVGRGGALTTMNVEAEFMVPEVAVTVKVAVKAPAVV